MTTVSAKKSLDVTAPMLAQIQKLAGTTLAASDIVVFDATAVSTRPVKKTGSIFDGAVMSKALLDEMAVILNAGTQAVPLHIAHMNYGTLPIGKVFQGNVVQSDDGQFELRTLFYLPAAETELVGSINLGVTNEVSVGISAKHLFCSDCGYDFVGEGSDYSLIWDRTCPSGHVVAPGGSHVLMSGVDLWSELSLVSRGASSKAKIHGPAETATQLRLAASGVPVGATTLFASSSPAPLKEAIMADPFDAQAAFDGLSNKFDTLLAALPKVVEVPPVVVIDPALTAALAEIETLKAGAADVITTKDALEELRASLIAGGVSLSATLDADKPVVHVVTGAFKSPRK